MHVEPLRFVQIGSSKAPAFKYPFDQVEPMSTQYTAQIVYGFTTEEKVGGEYIFEWVDENFPECRHISAGYYDDSEDFVGVIVNEVCDFMYSKPWMPIGPVLTVSDDTVRQVDAARAALIGIDPNVVLGPVGFYLVGSSS